MINGLDLFSGIGGITLALQSWVRPIAYCENDRYAQAVLLSRMSSGQLPIAPIWDDVCSLTARHLPFKPDLISGGFPCQDISAAGLGAGLGGQRSRLFFELVRLTEEIRPAFVFLENVPAIRTRGLQEVVSAFAELRYDCRWTCVSAEEIGAPHLRNRWFFVAHAIGEHLRIEPRGRRRPHGEDASITRNHGAQELMAHTNGAGFKQPGEVYPRGERAEGRDASAGGGWWHVEPAVDRVADGVPNRVDRIRGLGNAVVPGQAREAFKRLMGL